jgi:hypothetical protein
MNMADKIAWLKQHMGEQEYLAWQSANRNASLDAKIAEIKLQEQDNIRAYAQRQSPSGQDFIHTGVLNAIEKSE